MGSALERAMPELSRMQWDHWGPGINLYKDGVRKYQGCMLLHKPRQSEDAWYVAIGQLPNPKQSLEVVVRKGELLKLHPDSLASVEYRNPDAGDWGGAIRFDDPNEFGSLTGFPEVADHLLSAHGGHLGGRLSKAVWATLVTPEWEPIKPALEYVKMSPAKYKALSLHLWDIVFHSWKD